MGQLASTVGRLETQGSGKLPSQPINNPRESACAITLRSGKQLVEPSERARDDLEKNAATSSTESALAPKVTPKAPMHTYIAVPPFPSRLAKNKKEEEQKEILETFRKVQVNIPLLDAIKQVPRYAKFLQELCTNKRKLKGDELVRVGENVSAVLQRKLPPKLKDPRSFNIPGIIGNTRF